MKYTIELQPSGVSFSANAQDTVLNAALSDKKFLEHSCRKGDCGLCTAVVLSGEVKNELGNTVSSGKVLTCSSYPQSDLVLQANYFPELAEIECQTFPCKVVSLVFNTHDLVTLTLRLPPTAQFKYLPGQYIDLIYQGVRRSYSVANAQSVSLGVELHIRLLPEGEFSQLLSSGCEVGTLMRIEGPKGTFFVRKAANPLLFIAGGTGFAPIKAMVEELLHNNTDRMIYVYWGMANAASFYSDCPTQWLKQYDKLHYVPVVSEKDTSWNGRKGFVHAAVLEDFTHLNDFHVYACGSPLMINSAKETFIAKGLDESHFYADIFVPSK